MRVHWYSMEWMINCICTGLPIMMLSEGEKVVEEVVYPYPLMDENEIANSGDWVSDKVI